jgi:hypothetical protein
MNDWREAAMKLHDILFSEHRSYSRYIESRVGMAHRVDLCVVCQLLENTSWCMKLTKEGTEA